LWNSSSKEGYIMPQSSRAVVSDVRPPSNSKFGFS
jgi:hypothetical protein